MLRKDQFEAIDSFCRAFIAAHWDVLNDRAFGGRVREGHGDLRAEHICVEADQIDVIDCVEFSERLRYSDVASEIAFLAMDLDRLGASGLADELVEDYVEISGDEELASWPLLQVLSRMRTRQSRESEKPRARSGRRRKRASATTGAQLLRSRVELRARPAPALIVSAGSLARENRPSHARFSIAKDSK